MPSKNRKSLKLLSYLLIPFGILLILLLVSVNLLVPFYIHKELKSVSESKNIQLKAKTAGFGFFMGVKLGELTLEDGNRKTVQIDKVFVKPDYFDSIKEKKMVINRIALNKISLDLSGKSYETVKKLFSDSEDAPEDDEKKGISESILKIKTIKTNDLHIKAGKEVNIDLNGLKVQWNQTSRIKDSFNFVSKLAVNGNANSGMKGTIELNRKKKSADLYLQIENTARLYKKSLLKIPPGTETKFRAKINYLSGVESRGKLNLYKEGEKEAGELSYSLSYKDGNLYINKGRAQLADFADLKFSGKVEGLGKENLFNISSKLEIEDLGELGKWTEYVREGELNGNFESEKLFLKSSPENGYPILKGKGKFKDTGYQSDKYSIENVNSDLEFELNLQETKAGFLVNLDAGKTDIGFSDNIILSAKRIYTENPAEIKFHSTAYNRPLIEVKSIKGSDLKIHDYTIGKVDADVLRFTKKENGGFALYSALKGSGLNSENFNVPEVTGDLNVERKNDETGVYGELGFKNGVIGTYGVKSYSGEYRFKENKIRLENSKLKADHIDSAEVKNSLISLPSDGRSDIGIILTGANLSALDGRLNSNIKRAELSFDKATSSLSGSVFANNLTYLSQPFKTLDFDLKYADKKLAIRNLESDLQGGKLHGNGWINLKNGPAAFSADLEAENIMIAGTGKYPLKKLRTSVSGTLDSSNLKATGKVGLENLKVSKGIYSTEISGGTDLQIADETIYLHNGFIKSKSSEKIGFQGTVRDYRSENRRAEIDITETGLGTLKEVFYPLLPFEVQEGDLSGTLKTKIDIGQADNGFDWTGKISVKDAGLYTLFSLTEFSVEGVNGVVTVDKRVVSKNPLFDVIGKKLKINREVYDNYLNRLEKSKKESGNTDYLKVDRVHYGFLDVRNIETNFEMNHSKLNLNYFRCDIYEGKIIGTGVYSIKNSKYNVSILFDDMSLSSISDSIPSIRNYISGRFNGMMWINDGNNLGSIDGLFSLWTLESDKEKRSIGRALLEKIGATGRFFTGSSRRYDKGIISGYIKEGFMTFKELEISNTFLGYKDLKILVDEKKNSISVKQLLSVIREIAKRASSGGIQLDFEKNKE